MCRDGGKYLVLGHYCDAGTVAFNPQVITRKQLQVFGSWSSEPRHLEAALEFLQANPKVFPFAETVTHRFPLERAHEALMATANWLSAKSVIVPGFNAIMLGLLALVGIAALITGLVKFFRTLPSDREYAMSGQDKPEFVYSWR